MPDSVQALILSRGEALSIACMEQLLLARGEKVTLINPVEMLLAEGNFLESHVDIDVSRARFAATPVNEGHVYLMAGFTGGNAKANWCCWAVMVLITQQRYWRPVLMLIAADLDRRRWRLQL